MILQDLMVAAAVLLSAAYVVRSFLTRGRDPMPGTCEEGWRRAAAGACGGCQRC